MENSNLVTCSTFGTRFLNMEVYGNTFGTKLVNMEVYDRSFGTRFSGMSFVVGSRGS
jgi:hypothetical protein